MIFIRNTAKTYSLSCYKSQKIAYICAYPIHKITSMKKIISILAVLLITITAFAYDFTGKTFRGTAEAYTGKKMTVTAKFRTNSRLTMTTSGGGIKPMTDAGMMWEVSGDFINLYDSSGTCSYLAIDEDDNGEITLSMCDDFGNPYITLREVKASAAPKRSSKTSKRR